MFEANILEEIRTHILCSIYTFFSTRKSLRWWANGEKLYRAGQATDDSMTLAHCMLDN